MRICHRRSLLLMLLTQTRPFFLIRYLLIAVILCYLSNWLDWPRSCAIDLPHIQPLLPPLSAGQRRYLTYLTRFCKALFRFCSPFIGHLSTDHARSWIVTHLHGATTVSSPVRSVTSVPTSRLKLLLWWSSLPTFCLPSKASTVPRLLGALLPG